MKHVKAYGFDKNKSWERNVPDLLHQCGAMQQHIPYHSAVSKQKFQYGDEFVWKAGKQDHTYAKDLFEIDSNEDMPKSPALRLRTDLDGTSSPSYEGIEDLRPQVNIVDYIKIWKCPKFTKLFFRIWSCQMLSLTNLRLIKEDSDPLITLQMWENLTQRKS